jgi:hypothetical protein
MIVGFPVPRDKVSLVLPRLLGHLERAIAHSNGWTLEALFEKIYNDRCLLWAVIDDDETIGAAVTELHPDAAYIALVGGIRWAEWRHELRKVEQWAMLAGVPRVTIDGRSGWSRILRREGYIPDCSGCLSKELNYGPK